MESIRATTNAPDEYIRLEGLDETAVYSANGNEYGGDYLMNKGILFINQSEYKSDITVFKKLL